ncbi:MAG: hypothetical protein ACT4RN_14210 [Pseudonocardia sp.]
MSSATAELAIPPASAVALRAYAEQRKVLARSHRIDRLRLASDGKLVGHVDERRDAFDVVDFELAAVHLVGADVRLYSDRVLGNDNVSPELIVAQPL